MNAHLHPVMAAALAPFAPRGSETEYLTCPTCNGSGEGMYDGTRCHACKGSGAERVESEPDDQDEDDFEGAPV